MLREGVNAAELRKLGRLSVVIISMICLLLSSFIASLVQPAVAFASVVNEEDGAANGEEEAGNGADGAATDVNTREIHLRYNFALLFCWKLQQDKSFMSITPMSHGNQRAWSR